MSTGRGVGAVSTGNVPVAGPPIGELGLVAAANPNEETAPQTLDTANTCRSALTGDGVLHDFTGRSFRTGSFRQAPPPPVAMADQQSRRIVIAV